MGSEAARSSNADFSEENETCSYSLWIKLFHALIALKIPDDTSEIFRLLFLYTPLQNLWDEACQT